MIRKLAKGTIILTITGLITRVIGFLYKIYLSNILDGKTLGLYQLIFPVYGICFTLAASGIQTAISQLVAGKKDDNSYIKNILTKGILLSTGIAIFLMIVVYLGSSQIAIYFLGTIQCSKYLKIVSFSFIPCSISACINGFYYGLQETKTPALTQLFEQVFKVLYVYIFSFFVAGDNAAMCSLCVSGIIVGEGISALYGWLNIHSYFKEREIKSALRQFERITRSDSFLDNKVIKLILKLAVPLTGTRLIVSLLHGIETILIPAMLKAGGATPAEALSIYGILTGMALPFIMFPSTITNSLSVLLLPAISQAKSGNRDVKRLSGICILCSALLGVASTFIFYMFGGELGSRVFNNDNVGEFIEMLSLICPFMFIATTLTSIINGLGKTQMTFFITVLGLTLRILLTVKLVPVCGINGYLISLLISQIIITSVSYIYYIWLRKIVL